MVDLSPYAGAKGHTPATLRASADAADALAPARARLQRLVLAALAELPDATPLELVDHTGLAREAIQPRASELIALGLIQPTGARRRNPSGRSAAVLAITPAGRKALAS